MGGSQPPRLLDNITSLPTIWIFLWLGLAALTAALFVLMRTPWGQSRPLRKCAVLSLFAHALLACFATTIKIVSDTAGAPEAPPVWVHITSADFESDGQQRQTKHQPRLWDKVPDASVELPPQSLKRPAMQATMQEQTTRRVSLETLPGITLAAAGSNPSTDPMTDAVLPSAPAEHDSAGPSAASIDTPKPKRRTTRHTTMPVSLPARLGIKSKATQPVERSETGAPSTELLSKFAPKPRMAEVRPVKQPEPEIEKVDNRPSRPAAPAPAAPPMKSVATSKPAAVKESTSAAAAPSGRSSHDAQTGDALPAGSEITSAEGGAVEIPGKSQEPTVYSRRTSPDRETHVRRGGGGRETEASVEAALAWIAANQSADGRWDADLHGAGRERRILGHDREGAGIRADTGITALAVLAFLGAGHTHQDGKYRDSVRRALEFLKRQQAADGNLSGQASLFARMYCHSMATFALSEACAMTGDTTLLPAVRRATSFSLRAQHPVDGSWRYQPGDLGDTSQLGWQAMALKSADLAGVSTGVTTRIRMSRFLRSVSAGRYGGLARYRAGRPVSRAMTAEALYCRQLLGETIDARATAEATAYLLEELPGQGANNLYYWYYGTLSMYQVQGDAWTHWNQAMKTVLLTSQRTRGDLAGSWDPDTVWGGYGGRVYSTALAAMCLEVYYRYLPLYGER